MKRLLIIRHAKSSWKFASLSDRERPLNERGLRNAPFMAKTLLKRGIQPDLIISSNAVRALTTAVIFAQNLNYPKADLRVKPTIYEASLETIFEIVESIEAEANNVFLFGHNPTFTHFANVFLEEPIANIPTCGIVAIEFDTEKWQNIRKSNYECLFFDFPKNYK